MRPVKRLQFHRAHCCCYLDIALKVATRYGWLRSRAYSPLRFGGHLRRFIALLKTCAYTLPGLQPSYKVGLTALWLIHSLGLIPNIFFIKFNFMLFQKTPVFLFEIRFNVIVMFGLVSDII